ncbi:MAG: hypothetical protein FWE47_03750 [Oscillospiraceae bacterium]|nr:hypothetical protein [Oscillospiraceae bacterium]
MAFCAKCGAETEEKFCAACGAPATEPATKEEVAPPPTDGVGKDAQDNKVMGILSYLIFFIPLLTGDHKKSEFVKFHCNQGTVLFIASLILMVGWNILAAVLTVTIVLIPIVILVSGLIWLVPTIFAILGIINVCKGKMEKLPIVGNYTVIK